MKRNILLIPVLFILMAGAGSAYAHGGKKLKIYLDGYQEVPAVSTSAKGKFELSISRDKTSIDYKLSYYELEGEVTQAHIHLGQERTNGGVAAFLCSNAASAPAGTQACPPGPATITGTINADDVIGPAAQGIDAGELDELIRAIFAGVTYANVHSTKHPAGEIRGQIELWKRRH